MATSSAQKPSLYICTPCYGGMCTEPFLQSLLALTQVLRDNGINYLFKSVMNESLVPRARNGLVAEFLGRKEFTHLMFIDADIAFPPHGVLRLLESGHNICGAAYPKKALRISKLRETIKKYEGKDIDEDRLVAKSLDYNFNLHTGSNGQIYLDRGFCKMDHVATGFMMIKREVFEKWIETFPDDKYVNDVDGYNNEFSKDNFYTFFDCFISPESKVYLSEDYAFCYKAQTMGYEIFLDMGTALTHVGTNLYKGHVLELLSVADDLHEKQKQEQERMKNNNNNNSKEGPTKLIPTKTLGKSIPNKAKILPPKPSVTDVVTDSSK